MSSKVLKISKENGVTYDGNDGVIRYTDKIENIINRLVSSL